MCLDTTSNNKKQQNMSNSIVSNNMSEKSETDLNLKSIAGGNLIDYPALFDPNGETLYIIWGDKVKLFNVATGEWVRDLEDNSNGPLIGLHIDPENKKLLIACTANGWIVVWKLESFVISHKIKINLSSSSIVSRFVPTSFDGQSYGIFSFKESANEGDKVKIGHVDLSQGKILQNYNLPLTSFKVKIADGFRNSTFFAVTQLNHLYVLDKKSDNFVQHKNKNNFTSVCCHPEDNIIATGDCLGKIHIWRNIFDEGVLTTELHWHSMPVTSLAFSLSGSFLYSGGNEFCLLRWSLKNTMEKDVLPRFSGGIRQITVDPKNNKLAVATDDNAIQIVDSHFHQTAVIQNFSRVPAFYDFSGQSPFPVGIKLNPRNNNLILNGRIGYLQFFSTRASKMLYNMDISMKNLVPRERQKALYNTRVTNVTVSLDWMATAECWDDNEHSAEVRIKFWEFLEDKQCYSLCTHIEAAHEKGITDLEFSSKYSSDNLICVSSGVDNMIKVWSMDEQDAINTNKVWMCIEKLSYKNLPVYSLYFSQDSSLLAAGLGNVLCVWDTITFKLKCTLSAPACLDGSINRVIVTLPVRSQSSKKAQSKESIAAMLEKRKKTLELVRSMMDGTASDALVRNITQEKQRYFIKKNVDLEEPRNLSAKEKKIIFQRVLEIQELNFNQKIHMLHKLNIFYKISNELETEICNHIKKTTLKMREDLEKTKRDVAHLKESDRYQLQWKFQKFGLFNRRLGKQTVSMRKLLKARIPDPKRKISEKVEEKIENSRKTIPIKCLTVIHHVLFCMEEFSHLVIVTTDDRLLIWNLLTLKVQASFKLSVKYITLDPITNLIATFTKSNELFVFHPSPAIAIHHQKNMPEVFGAAWVPREHPTSQSLNVNWQSISQLYFLDHNQELCHLQSDNVDRIVNGVAYINKTNGFTPSTPFAAMLAKQVTNSTINDINSWTTKRIGVAGGQGVKEIIGLSSHAMPPLRILSKDFISSLLTIETKKESQDEDENVTAMESMIISEDEDDVVPQNDKLSRRQALENAEKIIKEKSAKKKIINNIENKLNNLKLNIGTENFESFEF